MTDARTFCPPPAQTYASVADAAAATPELSTLLAAVKKANLTDALSKGKMNITVFAPNNAAFERMLQKKNKTAAQLLEWDGLRSLLKAHIVKGVIKSGDIPQGNTTVKTWLADAPITVNKENGAVTAIGARGSGKVVVADIGAGNAVIHIVDGVIKPSKEAIKNGPAKEAEWRAKKAGAPAAAPGKSKSRRLAERI